MMLRDYQQIKDSQFDDSIFRKQKNGNNSGYLEDEYEVTKQFPTIHDFHFRIEDQNEIIELEQIQKSSKPICIQDTFNNTSELFKTRLSALLMGIDSQQVKFQNQYRPQKHGFYLLKDSYNDESAIEAVLENAKVEQIRKQVQTMNIRDLKPNFIKRPHKGQAKQSKEQINELSKKFRRITIREQDF